jgi:hypothetical protein
MRCYISLIVFRKSAISAWARVAASFFENRNISGRPPSFFEKCNISGIGAGRAGGGICAQAAAAAARTRDQGPDRQGPGTTAQH